MEDKSWAVEYRGRYVGFVDGNLVDSSPDRDSLVERLRHDFPKKLRFIEKVGVIEEPLDLATAIEIE
jgi:hypothetical protein